MHIYIYFYVYIYIYIFIPIQNTVYSVYIHIHDHVYIYILMYNIYLSIYVYIRMNNIYICIYIYANVCIIHAAYPLPFQVLSVSYTVASLPLWNQEQSCRATSGCHWVRQGSGPGFTKNTAERYHIVEMCRF